MKKVSSLRNLKEIGVRIKNLRKQFKLSQSKFVEKYNLKHQSNLSRYENGLAEPPIAFLLQLSRDAGVSVDWILTGEEPEKSDEASESKRVIIPEKQIPAKKKDVDALIKDITRTVETIKKIEPHLDSLSKLTKYIEKEQLEAPHLAREERPRYYSTSDLPIINPMELEDRLKEIKEREKYLPVPMLRECIISRNLFNLDKRDIDAYVLVNKNWLRHHHLYCCIKVIDNSMLPIIDKDVIAVIDCSDNQPLYLAGKIIAACHRGNKNRVIVRRLNLTVKHYILEPLNTYDYQPIKVPIEEKDIIIGEVAWWWVQSKK